MAAPRHEEKRERVRLLLVREEWATAPIRALAREAGVTQPLAARVRAEMGLRQVPRLNIRELQFLAQLFETGARGGDVTGLLRSEPARQLYQTVIAARGRT